MFRSRGKQLRGTNRLPGSFLSPALTFSLSLKALRAASSGEAVAKDDSESRSERADEGFSASVEANRLAQRGIVRRGICLRPNELAKRAPPRTVAMVSGSVGWNCSSTEVGVCRVDWKFPSKRLAAVEPHVTCLVGDVAGVCVCVCV